MCLQFRYYVNVTQMVATAKTENWIQNSIFPPNTVIKSFKRYTLLYQYFRRTGKKIQ